MTEIIQEPNIEHEIEEEIVPKNSPNNTLYINNLNERVRLDDLKEELSKLFSEFGTIIEIKAKKDIRMKG